jgi:hypothetical protein
MVVVVVVEVMLVVLMLMLMLVAFETAVAFFQKTRLGVVVHKNGEG